MSPDELTRINNNLRAAHERGKTGEALAAARRMVGDRRAGRGTTIQQIARDALVPARPSEVQP